MPNFRRNILWEVRDYQLQATVIPQGWRSNPLWRKLLGWWPYISGSTVQVKLHIDALAVPEDAEPVWIEFSSDVEYRHMRSFLEHQVIDLPFEFLSPSEYISAPDQYRYELNILGIPRTIADFTGLSKGLTIWALVLASLAVVGSTIGSLLVNLLL